LNASEQTWRRRPVCISFPIRFGLHRARLGVLGAVFLCSACASTPHTRVVLDYTGTEPIRDVTVAAVNGTGQELAMPPAGIIEQAGRMFGGHSDAEATIIDAFAHTATLVLTAHHMRVVPNPSGADRHLVIHVTQWDVRNDGAAGAVVFVSADYQLLDAHNHTLWHVVQDRLPIRLSGPNISRHEVVRAAHECVERAVAAHSPQMRGLTASSRVSGSARVSMGVYERVASPM
jgi:hypothetical protein